MSNTGLITILYVSGERHYIYKSDSIIKKNVNDFTVYLSNYEFNKLLELLSHLKN